MSNVIIVYGTVYGSAKSVAEHAKSLLEQHGHCATLLSKPTSQDISNPENNALLICTSTTGQGDIPGNIVHFYADLQSNFPMMNTMKAGIITLGDSSYSNSYGGAGEKFEELMKELQANLTQPRIVIDALEHSDPAEAATQWIEQWSKTL